MQTNKAEKVHVHARRSLALSGEPLNEARALRTRNIAGIIAETRKKVVHYFRTQQPLYRKGKNVVAKT